MKRFPESDPAGQPRKRPPGAPTPCDSCPKIPPGVPRRAAFAVELTPENRRCWEYYQSAKVMGWTEADKADPLVRWYARVIAEVERQVQTERERDRMAGVLAQLTPRGERGR